jgi:hypothetical protein
VHKGSELLDGFSLLIDDVGELIYLYEEEDYHEAVLMANMLQELP